MSGVVEFDLARLAEDKAAAHSLCFACRIPDKVPDFSSAGGPAAEEFWKHYKPGRMLNQAEALRDLVNLHADCGSGTGLCDDGGHAGDDGCSVTLGIAAIWNDHPGYKPEWK